MSSGYVRQLKKGPVQPLIQKWRYLKRARPEDYGGSFLKNAFAEMPEILFFGTLAIGSFVAMGYAGYIDRTSDRLRNFPYKRHYTVIRPDDPRIARLETKYYDRIEGVYEKPKYKGQE